MSLLIAVNESSSLRYEHIPKSLPDTNVLDSIVSEPIYREPFARNMREQDEMKHRIYFKLSDKIVVSLVLKWGACFAAG